MQRLATHFQIIVATVSSLMNRRQLSNNQLMNASQWLVEYLVALTNCLFYSVVFFFFYFPPPIIIIYIFIFARLLFGIWLICSSIFGHNFVFFFIKQLGQALRTCLRHQLDALRPRSGVDQHCRA